MLFRRRTSLSRTSTNRSLEVGSRPQSPLDSQNRETMRTISLSLDGMCAKAKGNPENALSKSALALRDIFITSNTKGTKPYQVALFGDKVVIFDGVFNKVFGGDVDIDEDAFEKGKPHYERLAGELQYISRKMSSPRNALDLGNALADINAAITRVPAKLEEDRRLSLGKESTN